MVEDDLLEVWVSLKNIGLENQILFLVSTINKLKRKNRVNHLSGAI